MLFTQPQFTRALMSPRALASVSLPLRATTGRFVPGRQDVLVWPSFSIENKGFSSGARTASSPLEEHRIAETPNSSFRSLRRGMRIRREAFTGSQWEFFESADRNRSVHGAANGGRLEWREGLRRRHHPTVQPSPQGAGDD